MCRQRHWLCGGPASVPGPCRALYRAAEVGAGIRGKILEAWAMERPVIATRLACCGLPARHEENLWIADSAGDFAMGLSAVKRCFNAAEAGGCRPSMRSGTYSWESATLRLEKVYRETLRDHASTAGRKRFGFPGQ